jgi:methyl-accepting chemotaxis protein
LEVTERLSHASLAAESIAGDASEAAKGTAVASNNVAQVHEAVKVTAEGTERIKNAASRLADLAGRLRDIVDQFKV